MSHCVSDLVRFRCHKEQYCGRPSVRSMTFETIWTHLPPYLWRAVLCQHVSSNRSSSYCFPACISYLERCNRIIDRDIIWTFSLVWQVFIKLIWGLKEYNWLDGSSPRQQAFRVYAVNHWEPAIATHEQNYPWAEHYTPKSGIVPDGRRRIWQCRSSGGGPPCTLLKSARGKPVENRRARAAGTSSRESNTLRLSTSCSRTSQTCRRSAAVLRPIRMRRPRSTMRCSRTMTELNPSNYSWSSALSSIRPRLGKSICCCRTLEHWRRIVLLLWDVLWIDCLAIDLLSR